MTGKCFRLMAWALSFSLAGCATAAQRQFQAISSGNTQIEAQTKACATVVYNDPSLASVRPHAPMLATDATLQQLADQSFATAEEGAALTAVWPRLTACRKATLEALVSTTPGFVPILTRAYSQVDDATILLIQHKLSWGDYAKRRRDIEAASLAATQAEANRVTAGLRQENDAELARRQAAANALAQWVQTQQVINAINRPVMTTCTATPGIANCISQ